MEAKEAWSPKETWGTKETATFIPPMVAVQTKELPPDIEWILESELKGRRTEAVINNGTVTLYTKDGSILQEPCKSITEAFGHVDYEVVIDGEITATEKENGEAEIVYCVFDILFLNGSSTLALPLVERKELLKDFLATISSIHVQCAGYVKGKGGAALEMAKDRKWQNIVAKDANSPYDANNPKVQWLRAENFFNGN